MIGWWPPTLATTFRFQYVVTVTLKRPRLNVGSAPRTQKFLGSEQYLTRSDNCQSYARIQRISGAPVTSLMKGVPSRCSCCLLHCSSRITRESICIMLLSLWRLKYLACATFRVRSLAAFACRTPPFSFWTVSYAHLGSDDTSSSLLLCFLLSLSTHCYWALWN
jgi:hypothetical protein